jgi:hypothetical protein
VSIQGIQQHCGKWHDLKISPLLTMQRKVFAVRYFDAPQSALAGR